MIGFRMHSAKLVLISSNLERRRSAETKIRNGEVKFVAAMIDDRRPLHFTLHHFLWELHEIILSDIILPTCPADR